MSLSVKCHCEQDMRTLVIDFFWLRIEGRAPVGEAIGEDLVKNGFIQPGGRAVIGQQTKIRGIAEVIPDRSGDPHPKEAISFSLNENLRKVEAEGQMSPEIWDRCHEEN